MTLLNHCNKLNTVKQHYQNYFFPFMPKPKHAGVAKCHSLLVLIERYDDMDPDTFNSSFTKLRNFKVVYSMHF
jgi:hypothetical protein